MIQTQNNYSKVPFNAGLTLLSNSMSTNFLTCSILSSDFEYIFISSLNLIFGTYKLNNFVRKIIFTIYKSN